MTFITLAESKTAKKGSIVVTVIKIGDLKAGSSSNGDWTRKNMTVQDETGAELMSVWNKDIEKFVLNHKYEITGIYWKESNGKLYLNYGQYSQLRDCGISTVENQSTIETSTETKQAPSSDEFLKQRQEELKKKQEALRAKSPLTEEQVGFVLEKAVIMYFIRKEIEAKITEFEEQPNGGMLWQMTEKIYDDFKIKFKETS